MAGELNERAFKPASTFSHAAAYRAAKQTLGLLHIPVGTGLLVLSSPTACVWSRASGENRTGHSWSWLCWQYENESCCGELQDLRTCRSAPHGQFLKADRQGEQCTQSHTELRGWTLCLSPHKGWRHRHHSRTGLRKPKHYWKSLAGYFRRLCPIQEGRIFLCKSLCTGKNISFPSMSCHPMSMSHQSKPMCRAFSELSFYFILPS